MTKQTKEAIKFITLDENALKKAVKQIMAAVNANHGDRDANTLKYLGFHQEVIDGLASFTAKLCPQFFSELWAPELDYDSEYIESDWAEYVAEENNERESSGKTPYTDAEAKELKAKGKFPLGLFVNAELDGESVMEGTQLVLTQEELEKMTEEELESQLKWNFANFVVYLDKELSTDGGYELTKDSVLYDCLSTKEELLKALFEFKESKFGKYAGLLTDPEAQPSIADLQLFTNALINSALKEGRLLWLELLKKLLVRLGYDYLNEQFDNVVQEALKGGGLLRTKAEIDRKNYYLASEVEDMLNALQAMKDVATGVSTYDMAR